VDPLIQLIYCSAAPRPLGRDELTALLVAARRHNERHGITGMLLHVDGSFFQVLEGAPDDVERLFQRISGDARHDHVTLIIREPLAVRAFGAWTMGHADMTRDDLERIVGANDFFTDGRAFLDIGEGRAKKLLAAFREGRWRATPSRQAAPVQAEAHADMQAREPVRYAFAFQPIIHAPSRSIYSQEALIRGPAGESAASVLQQVPPADLHAFRERQRIAALECAAQLGLRTRISINFQPSDIARSATAITSLLAAAERCRIPPHAIVLEVLETEIVRDSGDFSARMNPYRASGLTFAIDDFGAGYAGLNLLADFQPNLLKIDMNLVRGIQGNGPRQAILRGIVRTCLDLGIDIIAEGVETAEEYAWFRGEGIALFQGFLLARPTFNRLSSDFHLPD
jgi:EAL domain-containing protein (putative c-di-GMP-specific phosphodiesterase class I)